VPCLEDEELGSCPCRTVTSERAIAKAHTSFI
jgi:hypothetical protein